MRKKVGTVLDVVVLERARSRAAQEGKPLASLIEDALIRYLADSESQVALSYGLLIVSQADLEDVLEADLYDA